MREQVLIVLNEREQSKQRAASSLEALLKDRNITVSRLPIDANLVSTVHLRAPKVLVLDYLLGDITTGLDLLSSFQPLPAPKRPDTFFLTDEPSVRVAVDAMRLGAKNYFEIDRPRSINELSDEISLCIKLASPKLQRAPRVSRRLEDLTANSTATRGYIESARAMSRSRHTAVVLLGESGVGKRTLARAIHHGEGSLVTLLEVDCSLYDREYEALLDGTHESCAGRRLGENLPTLFFNTEHDQGELLTMVRRAAKRLVGSGIERAGDRRLYISTNSEQVARAWVRELSIPMIVIPSLSQRTDDLPSLIHHFTKEAAELADSKLKAVSPEAQSWLCAQQWPGNCAQLRGVLHDALMRCHDKSKPLRDLLEDSKKLWEESGMARSEPLLPDALTVAHVLEDSGYNHRIAAARIGCSVAALRSLIGNKPAPSAPRNA